MARSWPGAAAVSSTTPTRSSIGRARCGKATAASSGWVRHRRRSRASWRPFSSTTAAGTPTSRCISSRTAGLDSPPGSSAGSCTWRSSPVPIPASRSACCSPSTCWRSFPAGRPRAAARWWRSGTSPASRCCSCGGISARDSGSTPRARSGIALVPSNVPVPAGNVRFVVVVQNGIPVAGWVSLAWHPRRALPRYATRFVEELSAFARRSYPGRALTRRVPRVPRPSESG
jgi:hypothetical protein